LVTYELFREVSLLYPSVLISLSFKRAEHSHRYRLVSLSKEPNIPIFWTILIYPPIGSVLQKNPIFAELFWETWGYALVGTSLWPSYSGVPRQQM
jgi:hypothetical protein